MHRLLGTIDPVAVHGTGFRVLKEVPKIAKHDDTRINDEITATRCRLIGVDGSQLGLFDIRDAQRIADKIIASMDMPIPLPGDTQVLTSLSIGIAIYPESWTMVSTSTSRP